MRFPSRFTGVLAAFLATGVSGLGPASASGATRSAKPPASIPITTSSPEARALYLEGRGLVEQLRVTDARDKLQAAIARDPGFALAHLALATSATTNKDFFDALKPAVALAGKVTPAERHMILGLEAGARGDPATQKQHYARLVADFPADERAHLLLAGYHFGRQEYEAAVEEYTRATQIRPDFSPAYNQIGYAYRFLERYPEAERAFRKYIELIPGDPNPYDSYAELLMKTGRFEESIRSYEKALAVDPNFVASYVGIASNQVFLGHPDRAREALARLTAVARSAGERRQALFWIGVTYLHEGKTEAALAEIAKERAVAVEIGDRASEAADLDYMGNVLLEAGRPDEARRLFAEAVTLVGKADVPEPVKEAAIRNRTYLDALAALATKDDRDSARTLNQAYAAQVKVKAIPAEIRQQHEIAGRLALAGEDFATATSELRQANAQDPRVLYYLALAIEGGGDRARARDAFARVADFNALHGNYAFVRARARAKVAELAEPSPVAGGR